MADIEYFQREGKVIAADIEMLAELMIAGTANEDERMEARTLLAGFIAFSDQQLAVVLRLLAHGFRHAAEPEIAAEIAKWVAKHAKT